ncbi:hypothetical protein DDE82_008819 [Stemphylium lycopersici]|uniref:Uncharacterized protein n=1 Tax=Stemphylium lycopersici TaxID=183478 RepID=A0A364MTY4_STELY|nr:hypothetical protein TW65_08874 [Stemphylium lycopersici]RAQ98878.1 hypothetical protein DDE82_008819 [Stemphylium lycopersici]RAR02667.1 hypothetical protein DDE83_008504 [Stemphylium lycopersici]
MTNWEASEQAPETKKDRERLKALRKNEKSHDPGSETMEQQMRRNDSDQATLEPHSHNEAIPASGNACAAPTHDIGCLPLHETPRTHACEASESPTIAECTSPFAAGYALLNGSNWSFTVTGCVGKDEGS